MSSAPVVKKANQIAQFFIAQPDRRQAVADMARHLVNTWPPRQRQELQAAAAAGAALDALVHEVLAALAEHAASH
jgi:hypothetical protein